MSEKSSAPITPALLRVFLNKAPSMYTAELDSNAKNLILTNCYRALWSNDLTLMQKYFFREGISDAEGLTDLLRKHKLLDDYDDSAAMVDIVTSSGPLSETPSSQCGHLFKKGESVYRCRNCGLDDTCVMCSRCYHASRHEGHDVKIWISRGAGGCCDCGDPEAWKIPLECAIHPSAHSAADGADNPLHDVAESKETVPAHLLTSIRETMDVVLDYILETFASSPEEISPTSVKDIEQDRIQSHAALRIPSTNDPTPLYACVLWNDEKHTFEKVINVVRRATGRPKQFAKKVAEDVDAVGRRTLEISKDPRHLLRMAKTIHQETLAITVRSIQDTLREDICGLLLQWLKDLVSGRHKFFNSVRDGDVIVRDAICEALCADWSLRPELATLSTRARSARRDDDIDDLGELHDDFDDSLGDDDEDNDTEMQLLGDHPDLIFGENHDNDLSLDEAEDEDDEEYQDDEDMYEDSHDWGEIDEQLREREQFQDDDISMTSDANPAILPPGTIAMNPLGHELEQQRHESSSSDLNRRLSNASHPKSSHHKQPHDIADHSTELEPWLAFIQKMESSERNLVRSLGVPVTVTDKSLADADNRLRREFKRKLRLDYLLQFDLRLWKSARTNVKDLLTGTFISNFNYRPILGIRYARNYTDLVDAFFFKDREPEHSISTLSVQLLTVPTVAATLVKDYKFFGMVCSILTNFFLSDSIRLLLPDEYHDMQVNCQSRAIERHRYACTFFDLRYVLNADQVKEAVASDTVYIHHFIDMLYRFQEMDPLKRQVGTHVEFESTRWVNAFNVTLQISKLCRQFADSYVSSPSEDASRNLCRSIYRLMNAIIEWQPRIAPSDVGGDDSDDESLVIRGVSAQRFHEIDTPHAGSFTVVDYDIANESVSFHHPFHWLLSELLSHVTLMQDELLMNNGWPGGFKQMIQGAFQGTARDLFLVLIDYPLRTIALLAQVNCGVWVRNGYSLQNQARTYRDLSVRENTYDRDIYLLQTAFVATDPDHLLVTILDRFKITEWFKGKSDRTHPDYEPTHITYIVEEFLQLLIICATEHGYASGMSTEAQIRRSIIQYLGISNLAYSELLKLLPDSLSEHASFESQLTALANFKPPDGLSDRGMYGLKSEYVEEIEPYFWHYTRNQREEAYDALKQHANRHNPDIDLKGKDEFLVVPRSKKITAGPFKHLGNFLHTRTLCQIILHALWNAKTSKQAKSDTILDGALYLAMLAVTDENNEVFERGRALYRGKYRADAELVVPASFVQYATQDEYAIQVNEIEREHATLLRVLLRCLDESELKHAQKRLSFIVSKMEELGSKETKAIIAEWRGSCTTGAASPETDKLARHAQAEHERKKEAAKARQAAVMSQFAQAQQQFMSRHGDLYDDEDEDEEVLEKDLRKDATMSMVGDSAEVERMCHFPSGTCIVCQEELDRSRLYGMLGMVQNSHILRKTPLKNASVLQDILDMELPNHDRPDTVDKDPNAKVNLAGFSPDEHTPGLHMSSCGHMMHAHCFDNYHASVESEELGTIPAMLRLPRRKRFLCPLCKALGNVLLPVVWKGKQESYPGVVTVHTPYTSIESDARMAIQALEDAIKTGTRERIPGSMPDLEEGTMFVNPEPANITITSVDGLNVLYSKLLKKLDMTAAKPNVVPELNVDLKLSIARLLDMYAYTIAAIEIAQRGVARQTTDLTVERTGTFLDGVSTQNQTLLKILAKTIELLPRVMNTRWVTDDRFTMNRLALDALHAIFYQPGKSAGQGTTTMMGAADPFQILTQIGFCQPNQLEVHHIMRLSYLAELTKTTIGLMQSLTSSEVLEDPKVAALMKQARAQQAPEASKAYQYASMVMSFLNVPATFVDEFFRQIGPTLFVGLLRIFSLPFLRKCLLLLVVHHGYVVQNQAAEARGSEEDEYDTLLAVLRLPAFETVFDLAPHESSIVQGWCSAYSAHVIDTSANTRPIYTQLPKVSLNLPTRFSLVSLPYRMDQLFDESLRRVCLQCKSVPEYPALCLMCGDFVCARRICCTVDDKGECNTHMEKCGGDIGAYMVVKECFILLLHGNGGTIMSAPYLDAHGEADLFLKRGTPQYLNPKRYEQIRHMWLSHSIPAFVRRRMESSPSYNNWEYW